MSGYETFVIAEEGDRSLHIINDYTDSKRPSMSVSVAVSTIGDKPYLRLNVDMIGSPSVATTVLLPLEYAADLAAAIQRAAAGEVAG